MPDKTTLVLRDSDGEVIDTITTTLPSEIASLRSRGYATTELHEQLAAARKAATDGQDDELSDGASPSDSPQTASSTTDEEGTADKPAARGGKKSSTTGR